MKVGDLVRNRHGNIGIITKSSRHHHGKHWWVEWVYSDPCALHQRFLEVVCK